MFNYRATYIWYTSSYAYIIGNLNYIKNTCQVVIEEKQTSKDCLILHKSLLEKKNCVCWGIDKKTSYA